MTINDKILHLIKTECDGNKRAFAQRVGVSGSVIENIVGKRQSKPSFDVLKAIVSNIDRLNAEWLFNDFALMYKNLGDRDSVSLDEFRNILVKTDELQKLIREVLEKKDHSI